MTVANPCLDIATAIAARVGTLTLGTNVFAGPVRPSPDEAVFVLASGGGQSVPYRGTDTGSGPDQLRNPSVQVFVRSANEDYASGAALSRTVRNALDCREPTGYVDVRAQQSAPIYLEKDDEGRHRWSLNFSVTVEETAA